MICACLLILDQVQEGHPKRVEPPKDWVELASPRREFTLWAPAGWRVWDPKDEALQQLVGELNDLHPGFAAALKARRPGRDDVMQAFNFEDTADDGVIDSIAVSIQRELRITPGHLRQIGAMIAKDLEKVGKIEYDTKLTPFGLTLYYSGTLSLPAGSTFVSTDVYANMFITGNDLVGVHFQTGAGRLKSQLPVFDKIVATGIRRMR